MRTRFGELLDMPGELEVVLRSWGPDFCFHLMQLVEMPFETIRG